MELVKVSKIADRGKNIIIKQFRWEMAFGEFSAALLIFTNLFWEEAKN